MVLFLCNFDSITPLAVDEVTVLDESSEERWNRLKDNLANRIEFALEAGVDHHVTEHEYNFIKTHAHDSIRNDHFEQYDDFYNSHIRPLISQVYENLKSRLFDTFMGVKAMEGIDKEVFREAMVPYFYYNMRKSRRNSRKTRRKTSRRKNSRRTSRRNSRK